MKFFKRKDNKLAEGESAEKLSKLESKASVEENPYISARREYGDRYGSAVRDAAIWRRVCFALMLLVAVFGGSMMWLAAQNKVVPYIVQVDKMGYAVAIKPATATTAPDPRVVMSTIGRFVIDHRTVVADGQAQDALIKSVYSYLADSSSAQAAVNGYYEKNNPFLAAQRKGPTQQVQIKSIMPQGNSGKSWQVLWTEETILDGIVSDRRDWRAIITIALSPVQDLTQTLKNPLGIYIVELNIARDIG